jgi:mercuric ion transport protein
MTTRSLDEKDKYAVTGSALGAVGSAALAIFASLCCVGPAVVVVVGAGGAVAAAGLVPYRPYFLAASFALLGIGFWRSYWPRRSSSGAACGVSTGRRVRATLWASLAVSLVAAVLSFLVP